MAGLAPTDSSCNAAIENAQEGIDGFFKDNIRDLLTALE